MPLRIVVLDSDPQTHALITSVVQREGHEARIFATLGQVESHIARFHVDVLLLNSSGDKSATFEALQRCRRLKPQIQSVVLTDQPNGEVFALAILEGAIDCLNKPIDRSQLQMILSCVHEQKLRPRAPQPVGVQSQWAIVGQHPRMLEIYRTIGRVAKSDVSILIAGGRGSGKELVARTIHNHGNRSGRPFIPVSCSLFSEVLIESALFDPDRPITLESGKTHKNLIEAAAGGTLYLDEIADTSLSFQTQLFRVMQDQQLRRLGPNRRTGFDVRIIAGTDRDILPLVEADRFRRDLYDSLSVVQISLPALSERREDIPMLVQYFIERFNRQHERTVSIDPEAAQLLQQEPWPGNVRELENTVQRLALFNMTDRITASSVRRERANIAFLPATTSVGPGSEKLVEVERRQIQKILKETNGNKSETARRLGIQRKTLYKKARRLGIILELSKYRPNKNAGT